MRVLLVDDEELALVALKHSVQWKQYGFTDIISVKDPLQALDYLKNIRIDAVFVDIRMPGMSGLELISRANSLHVDVYFVIVSGYSDFTYAKEALRLGALDYCLKPIDPEEITPIMEKLSDCIRRRHLALDPDYASSLLTDLTQCENYLRDLYGQQTMPKALTLVQLRSEQLLSLLSFPFVSYPPDFLFFNASEILLIWKDVIEETKLNNYFQSCCRSSLMIATYISQCNALNFQTALKRLRKESHNRISQEETGLRVLPSINTEMTEYIYNILNFMNTHYTEKISLRHLSKEFGVNYTYLSQLFKKTTGKSFSEYLTEIRLSHACHLLKDTELKITLISERVGFNDYHYFCNVFKHEYTVSPLQYRNSVRSKAPTS